MRLILFVTLSVLVLQAQNVTEIKIDVSIHYQEIDNFGASDCWSFQKIGEWYTVQKERVADLLFSTEKGIGLSAWRFNIGAGINRTTIRHPWRTVETFEVAQGEYDWTRQEEERWFLQAAKERGVDQFIAFVNSPPARMTRNGYTNCTDGLGSTNLKPGYEGQYATYLVDILKHFKDEWDIEFDYISPVNEPQWEWNNSNQEGNRAANEDIKTIVRALHAELLKQGVSAQISVTESGALRNWYEVEGGISSKYGKTYGNYLSAFAGDSEIRDMISHHMGGHSYWSDRLDGQLIENRQTLYQKMIPYLVNGWKYWMTEYCILDGPEGAGGHGRDLTIKTALDVARVIHYDLTILKASAWQWWTAVSPEDYKDGLIYTDYKDNPSSQSIIESKLLWAVGNFSRFIRPGSVRIHLENANNKVGLMGSAYLNPDRNQLIIVFINAGYSNEKINLDIADTNSGNIVRQFIPYITSDNKGDDLKEGLAVSADSVIEIPARSVVTLLEQIDDPSRPSGNRDNPKNFTLFQNYPNPFNMSTTIEYFLEFPEKVKISIFSSNGEEIKILEDSVKQEGFQTTVWDGTNNTGQLVSSGIYYYKALSNGLSKTRKMILLK